MILGLCERFHCLPSQLMEEDAGLIRLMKIQQLGTRREVSDDEPGADYG